MKMMFAAGEFVSMETYEDCKGGGGEQSSNQDGHKFFESQERFDSHRDAGLQEAKKILRHYEDEGIDCLAFWCARLRVDIMFLNRIGGLSTPRPFVCEVRLVHTCAFNHTTTYHTCLT